MCRQVLARIVDDRVEAQVAERHTSSVTPEEIDRAIDDVTSANRLEPSTSSRMPSAKA